MIVLTIPELTPSLNQTLRQGHWSKRARHRKHWSMLVLVAKSEAGIYALPRLARARVTIERHGGRAMDLDNFAGGAKALIDGLRDNGVIVNDDPEHMILNVEQFPGGKGKERKTIVRIESA